jgi:hypothetical protein
MAKGAKQPTAADFQHFPTKNRSLSEAASLFTDQ